MMSLSQVIVTIAELLSIYMMFLQFESVGGWSFYEVALMSGTIITIFSLTECFARGYDEFPSLIKNGELDRMLVRPVGIHKQIFGSKTEFMKLGRTILGIVVCIIALSHLNIQWNIWKVLVILATIICGFLVILGLFMIGAGISVFTVENLEFVNIITYGSKELAYYPLDIYKKWLSRFFTFVIPIACFNYLPVSFLLEKGNVPPILCGLSPLFGIVFFIPCFLFMNWCLTKYKGTGT